MRWFTVVLLSLLAYSAAAEDLFSLSHFPWKAEGWESVEKAERINFRKESLALPKRGLSSQALSPQATKVKFQVEGIGYEADTARLEVRGKDFSWFGKVGESELSHFAIVGEAVTGEIVTPEGRRSVVTRDGATYLVKQDPAQLVRLFQHDVLNNALTTHRKRRSVGHRPNPDACSGEKYEQVDAMFPYTPQALHWFSTDEVRAEQEIKAWAQNAVDAVNAAVINTTKEWKYRVRLVHAFKVNHDDAFLSGGWASDDADFIMNSAEVAALRDKHKADVVMLLVANVRNSAGASGKLRGAGEGFAVGIVTAGAQVPVHEFGHAIWDMGHDPDHWDNPDPAYAQDHFVNGVFFNIMATPGELCERCDMLYSFANPNVSYKGIPTGVPGERENWRQLANTSYTKNLRISGQETVCVSQAAKSLQNQQPIN